MSTNNEPTNELATNSLQAQSIDCVGTTYVKPVMWRTRLASVIALLIILLGVFLYSQDGQTGKTYCDEGNSN